MFSNKVTIRILALLVIVSLSLRAAPAQAATSSCTIYAYQGKVMLHLMHVQPGEEVRYYNYNVYKGRIFRDGYWTIGAVTNEGARHWAAKSRGVELCHG